LQNFLRGLSYPVLIAASLLLGLAPFVPEPHAVEKVKLLVAGQLTRPLDIFDLLFHLSPALLLLLKFLTERRQKTD